MSFMERSNWKDPNNPRRYRIFIPLAVALVVVAGAIVALNSKVVLTAFGGAQNCQTASPAPSQSSGGPVRMRKGPGGHRGKKGAEAVTNGSTPAAAPTAKPGAPVGGAAAAPAGANMAHAHRLTGAKAAAPSASPADSAAANGNAPAASASAGAASTAPGNTAGNQGNNGQANPSASAAPSTGQSTSASAAPSAAPSASNSPCPPQNGGGNAAAPNANCTLVVPPNPLTAKGLATPYQMTATDAAMGPCNEANVNQSAFVQATVIDPATGKVSVYSPLVVDKGTQPAAAPVVPNLPAGAVVGIWFGYNSGNLTLQDSGGSLAQGKCVNGLNGSVFGQFAYCNAPAFFTAANNAIKAGNLTVPALGTADDGMPCMSTREFALIDQDQSDNVQTQYLANGNGQIAQSTAANKANMANATTLANPSDNALLDVFVDPALGCKPWMAPDLANNGAMTFSLALDELQADAGQAAPSALVPLNDPMVLVNGNQSQQKTNLYRAGVDMPALPAGQTPQQYCQQMDTIQAARLQKDMAMLAKAASPMPDAANSLFTFLGMRLQGSFGNLNCQNFGLTNPVSQLAMQGNVVVGVTFANGAGNGGNGGGNGGNGGNGNGGNGNGGTASPTPSPTTGGNGGGQTPTASPTPTTGTGNGGGMATPTTSPKPGGGMPGTTTSPSPTQSPPVTGGQHHRWSHGHWYYWAGGRWWISHGHRWFTWQHGRWSTTWNHRWFSWDHGRWWMWFHGRWSTWNLGWFSWQHGQWYRWYHHRWAIWRHHRWAIRSHGRWYHWSHGWRRG